MPEPSSTTPCPVCGTPGTGKFCSSCGASLSPRACALCRAELSPQARFCHRCGQPVSAAGRVLSSPATPRAWTIAAVLCLLLVGGIVYKVLSAAPEPKVPDMANAGAESGDRSLGGTPASEVPTRAPDISAMSPRERFDRLFNRIMQAGERQDSVEVRRFTPMALGAYEQLETRDIDARYHAAVLHLGVADFAPAYALADTILKESPGHLFAYVIRGTAAGFQGDTAAKRRAELDFLTHYQREMASKRVEYLEHKPVIDEFKQQAERQKDGKTER